MSKQPGVYETEYGNAAIVEDWDGDWAYDIDMDEEIPIEMVSDIFIRDIEE